MLGFQTGKNITTDIEHVVGSAVSQVSVSGISCYYIIAL